MENKDNFSKLAQAGKAFEQAGKITGKEVLKTTLDTAKQLGKNIVRNVGDDALKQMFKFIPNLIGDSFETIIKNKRMYKYVIGTPIEQFDKMFGAGCKASLEEISDKALTAAIKDKNLIKVLKENAGGSSLDVIRKLHSEKGIQSFNLSDDLSKTLSKEISDPNCYKTLMSTMEKGLEESAKLPGAISDLVAKTKAPGYKMVGKGVGYGITASTIYTIISEIYDGFRQRNMILSEKINNLEKELTEMYKPGLFFENKQPVDFIVQAKKTIEKLKKERVKLSGIEAKIAMATKESDSEEDSKFEVISNKEEIFGSLKRISLILDDIPRYLDLYISKVMSGDYNGSLGLTALIGKSRDSAKIITQHIAAIKSDISIFEETIGEKIVNLTNYKTTKKPTSSVNLNKTNTDDSEMEAAAKEFGKISSIKDSTIKSAITLFSEVSSFLSKE